MPPILELKRDGGGEPVNYEIWISRTIFFLLAGVLIWALKELRKVRTRHVDDEIADLKADQDKKPQSAGATYLTVAEIDIWLGRTKKEILEETEKDMKHVRELIEKDLAHGAKKIDELGDEQKKTRESMGELTSSIQLLQQSLDRLLRTNAVTG